MDAITGINSVYYGKRRVGTDVIGCVRSDAAQFDRAASHFLGLRPG